MSAAVLIPAAYLVGSVPFGYLVARLRGVNIFEHGSGNIGATNVGRVLGVKYGLLVFVLDFAKGAGSVLAAAEAADAVRVGVGLAAFVGHLFPLYLGLRGGKGVATGAGVCFALLPGSTSLAILVWLGVVASTRIVSLASLAAVAGLIGGRLLGPPDALTAAGLPLTVFALAAGGMVVLKHRSNIQRLRAGTESRWADRPRYHTMSKLFHVMAVGLWFGSAVFFNLIAAPVIFTTFDKVVKQQEPDYRTAGARLVSEGATAERQKQVASALAGTAVGPLFPIFFALEAACGVVVLATAAGWRYSHRGRFVHRLRVWLAGVAVVTVAASWFISQKVSELRVERASDDSTVAEAAGAAFGQWHMISLALSLLTVLLAAVLMGLAAKVPETGEAQPTNP